MLIDLEQTARDAARAVVDHHLLGDRCPACTPQRCLALTVAIRASTARHLHRDHLIGESSPEDALS